MTVLEDKQLKQVLNIMETLLEATEHFSTLIKKKELNQSVYILSSIVNGFEAVDQILASTQSTKGKAEGEKIERSINLITKQLEQGNFLKVSEIVQFSLMPQLRKWKQTFESNRNIEQKQSVTIGVYLCPTNPRKAYTEARINALVNEAERQEVNLLFFSSDDVDFDKKQVTADVFDNDEWQRVTGPFPDVINNIGSKSRMQYSRTERKLRREIPFTSFSIGNKLHLPRKLAKSGKFAELLVGFKIASDETIIHDFLNKYGTAVFKPLRGRKGENIYFVKKKGNRYSFLEHKKEQILSREKFEKWIREVILRKKNSYMVQRYIECRTKDEEPYDIRAHVQKDGEGKWQLTRIYPRIGHKKSILSNVSQGGRTEELGTLFANEFGDSSKQYESDIRKLSMDLTWHVDKLYGLALDELGLDLAIDKNGRFWLHEVNTGPQSTHHEGDRAINTIAYAEYIANNGLFFTNEFDKKLNVKGQFNAQNTDLPWANLDDCLCISMLVNQNEINNLTIACAYVAYYENKHFYYFSPKDIDYDEMLIRGYFYENKQWVPKVVEYPDVIYDRLRLRGIKGYTKVYEELQDIPFTNEFYGNSISKLEVYDKLQATKELDDTIIPYQKVHRVRDIFHYIEHYGEVILKPDVGSFAKGVHFISKSTIDDYFVAEGENESHYNEMMLTQYLRDLLKKGTFIVQKYIETRTKEGQPFDIRVHMMKDGNGEWSSVESYPRVGINHAAVLVASKGGYMSKLSGFLERNYGKKNVAYIEQLIESLSEKITYSFEGLYEENLGEVALDLAIDKEMQLSLIEVNVNKPGINYYEFDVAQHAIPYAIYLAEEQEVLNKVEYD
ncbi:glutathione synthase/RimK-type ligase-like ATP-grasp enzyme [Virgibacillus natechei]|uniref:Glutathione synthase/RimK-type ligase-like ATP-grasp enzyme n=1 Tax=Virgibacillus natechei TaxID=1216297 RepID=A0ABS4ILC5_9BACI|nr:YheC/YheD family protein [Virgibacillus natechei]MBP1971729.1 glutathione synthase/RimK-type ligase-like ATP-grasp enzyme [Virgibacillus natechei]UZD12272.1 YheC/YheD family protein [Virgibacillus natechei]